MTNRKTIKKKYLLLISVLVLMTLLCACRTRITNNPDVSATISDEDGVLTGEYDMRRQEIGEPVAEKPIFTGWGSPEEEPDLTDVDTEPFDTYDPNETDPLIDPPESTTTEKKTDGGGGSGGGTSKVTPKKPVTPKAEEVTITLDLNDGADTKNTITTETGKKFGDVLPTEALRDGYVFDGWHTDRNDPTPVDLEEKIIGTSYTFFAHWKEATRYTVSFNGNPPEGVTDQIVAPPSVSVAEGGVYGALPDAVWAGHLQEGWFTEPECVNQVKAGDNFTANADQILYAKWGAEDWPAWYAKMSSNYAADVNCYIYSASDSNKATEFIQNSKGAIVGENPAFVLLFGAPTDEEKAAAKAQFPDATVLIVPDGAIGDDANLKLIYNMQLLNCLHDNALGADAVTAACTSLGIGEHTDITVYTPPAPAPDPAAPANPDPANQAQDPNQTQQP